ncbi:MAG TPA: carboxypeptidase-like regulatory domain-containing protein, partial [Bacteroidia bacterium]
NSYLDVSDFQGKYEAGAAVPGTYTVTFSKVGFTTGVDTVHLSAGVVKIDTLKLCPSPTFTYTGRVFDNVTSAGIAGAHVSVFNANSRWDTITDANGNYSFHTIYDGNYSVAAGKWGYITKSVNNQNLTYSSPPMNIGLAKGLYDDFMWDYGWTVSGNATQGMWVRDVPLGTPYQSTFANPNVDVPSDCGYDAYVTGNTGVTSSDDDVDGGATVLMSPTFDLTSYSNPYIFYSRWKALYSGTTDSVAILLSNGVSTVVLEDLFYNSPGQSQWVNRNYRISPKITPTANMNVIVIASDNGPDNIVEAGFDKFFIKDSANSAVESINEDQVFVKVYPNPFSENAILRIM